MLAFEGAQCGRHATRLTTLRLVGLAQSRFFEASRGCPIHWAIGAHCGFSAARAKGCPRKEAFLYKKLQADEERLASETGCAGVRRVAGTDWTHRKHLPHRLPRCCAPTCKCMRRWPKVANSDNHSWDHHQGLTERIKGKSGPMLDQGLSALFEDLDQRGLLSETLVVCLGEFGRSPERGVSTSGNNNSADGRDHWPYCYTSIIGGAGIKRGYVHGESDKTASAPKSDPVHPTELLATIYHAFGIDPETIVYNHLNQPRELVKAKAVTKLFA
jgi:hypothetical protein